ncbi:MAG: hypothetical protein B7Y59_06420 [Burkholderiales bacterium 35-55-47]|jgi:uncharacterized membrane protein YedE/YeeE|uniref:YeeE/YedE family protein n=1 Tax=Limnohabitans sp. TaxID=1907725 RepID=UPI000BDD1829|nr:YeeE/YedE thiosulfate transporter family protein [Limnohabitans sp.]OYY18736.1 MAG: hypothetical protein B7Y59_06420 [Burkholderiales bacterium 35-55-47]OYZ73554.1 MAG: hypothetical protein B7Y06_05850 [Burkholderiales bacterium 24-55-52]OZB00700.1 MAG: hypothetical protein B7X62_05865 [Burkholderiales bacterium 39-55-53]HQR85551.1 YeeE/YedE thiosulfate transporter family protein [Limnohabitans sp.]HQS26532.1 YeeE/YedE thiosulfate transporter family protein [Limnohabitans sp.]
MTELFPTGWAHYLNGGLLIGAGVSLMFVLLGRVVGMSTVFSSTWSFLTRRAFFQQSELTDSRVWRLVCALGLVAGAALWWWMLGPEGAATTEITPLRLAIGGVLVGFGARLSNGCTSGHGICGLSSLSRPSLAAVLLFMVVAIITANVMAYAASAVQGAA